MKAAALGARFGRCGFNAAMTPHFPPNRWRNGEIPPGARIVVFTGHPRPHETAEGKWPAPWRKKSL